MLASTIQFSHNTNHHHQPPPRNTRPATSGNDRTQEQQHPTTTRHPTRATKQEEDTVPFQTPDSAPTYQHHFPRRGRTMRPHRQASTQNKRDPTTDPTGATSSGSRLLKKIKLLRKEVIQPHLPVRLPCYDFVPIANPTFDSSPSKELGHWLRVLPTFMT